MNDRGGNPYVEFRIAVRPGARETRRIGVLSMSRRRRKASGLSGRQWKKARKAERRAATALNQRMQQMRAT